MSSQNPRAANACETCRRRKVKCSGEQPCRSCARHGWECVFGRAGRRPYSEAHVQRLLDTIKSYEAQLNNQARQLALASPPVGSARPQLGPGTPVTDAPRQPPEKLRSYADADAAISPATDLASGPAFESQVRSLLHGSHQPDPSTRMPPRYGVVDEPGTQWASVRTLINEDAAPSLPSLEESQQLLDRFLFYLGVSQHFFDPRSFSDSTIFLFQGERRREQQMRTPWFTEYLLVIAMAKLMDVDEPNPQPPGANFFAEAMKRLPPLHQLGEEGVVGVEILTLIATYLQWCDRKHDAYLYIGLALRLAIALGCDQPAQAQDCLPSEAAHRVRLWWTVYMLDRRLSSGLGLAAGADERQLCAQLPRHAPGFQSPVALSINVRIARATDDIMTSLYGNASITQLELVQKVQKILHDLYETGRSFPAALVLDFTPPLHGVTRTGASLYLMLFQAIILCVRPILLQRVRQHARTTPDQQTQDAASEIIDRLCETCTESATKSLAILHALQHQRTIPRYGFFDLDATFSAAFILLMSGCIDKTRKQPPPALYQAIEVLRFLSSAGNAAAERRLHDIMAFCSHVWPTFSFESSIGNQPRPQNTFDQLASNTSQKIPPNTGPNVHPLTAEHPTPDPATQQPPYPPLTTEPTDESQLLENWTLPDAMNSAFDMSGNWDLDLSLEADGIYSSFHDPTLPLTGVDYSDWVEVEKLFAGGNL